MVIPEAYCSLLFWGVELDVLDEWLPRIILNRDYLEYPRMPCISAETGSSRNFFIQSRTPPVQELIVPDHIKQRKKGIARVTSPWTLRVPIYSVFGLVCSSAA